ncbi:competence protein ComEC [Catalinimonas alkaloidigena]|uniref:Competence protein ComEC n=1 Tax=Catalinimonas alkaloidigena TaxID=1075417 RepID=A0A1G9UPQ2_9BACT|nr:ComEC/Rec2 family competence protein [Catalinimonas alkaloidigena]SDM61909.1 competence protein ComEC [Catalinimonas alkaloidigena]
MGWAPYSFVRIAIFFALGILLGMYLDAPWYVGAAVTAIALITYCALLFGLNKTQRLDYRGGLGLAGLVAVAGVGMIRLHQTTALNTPQHLFHRYAQVEAYEVVLNAPPRHFPTYTRAEVQVPRVRTEGQWQATEGKLLLYLPADSAARSLVYGDVLLVNGTPDTLRPPMNPDAFDFRAWLHQKQILLEGRARESEWLRMGYAPPHRLLAWADHARRSAAQQILRYFPHRESAIIAQALILGVRDELSSSLRARYAAAGVMHVLAVSGLHVGIIYEALLLALGLLFRPWRETKRFEKLSVAFALLLLWLYAFLTGLTPSVLRATVMFSVFGIGSLLGRKALSYNKWAFSAFLLLFFNPWWLVDVGFQLSFLAVLGILYLYDDINALVAPRFRTTQYLWKMVSVTTAAQLATFPLSLYYFHQFPPYFLLANLVVLPLVSILVVPGLLVFLFIAWVPLLAPAGGWVLSYLIVGMNHLLDWLNLLPGAVQEGIFLSPAMLVLLYALIVLLLAFIARREMRWLTSAMAMLLLLCGLWVYRAWERAHQSRVEWYSFPYHTALGVMRGQHALLIADSTLLQRPGTLHYQLDDHFYNCGIRRTDTLTWQEATDRGLLRPTEAGPLLVWQGETFLLAQNPYATLADSAAVDYLVVTRRVAWQWERFSTQLRFRHLLLSGTYTFPRQTPLYEPALQAHDLSRQGAWLHEPRE